MTVDGARVDSAQTVDLQGHDVQRRARTSRSAFGYTNASWTLKCDLTCEYVCRLLEPHGEARLSRSARRARSDADAWPASRWIDFTSGYVQRSIAHVPEAGLAAPWRLYQNYALDTLSLTYAPLEDGAMEFSG